MRMGRVFLTWAILLCASLGWGSLALAAPTVTVTPTFSATPMVTPTATLMATPAVTATPTTTPTPSAVHPASGDLDPTFGSTGIIVAGVGSAGEEALAVAPFPGGGMVLAGTIFNGTDYDFLVLRYREDGYVHPDFFGPVILNIAGDDMAFDVAIQPDGTIYAAGSACGSSCQFALVRLESDGSSSGPVTADFGTNDAEGRSVAVQSDGKVLVAGFWYTGTDYDVGLVRLLPDGNLDQSFGLGGKVTSGTAAKDETAGALLIQPDGKIVVGGDSCTSVTCELLLIRYLPDGTLDPSFGTGGVVTTPLSSGSFGGTGNFGASVNALALQADGKIVASGLSYQDIDNDFAVARYLPDGTLDATFGIGGTATTRVGAGEDQPLGMALDPDTGTITLAGYTCSDSACTPGRIGLVRYQADGSLDPSFGTGGVVTTTIGPDAAGDDIALLPGGRTVVVGSTLNGATYDLALVGYQPDGEIDRSFGGGTVTSAFTTEDIAYAAAIQADGRIVVAGGGTNPGSYVLEVARYEADGTIDPSFGTGGVTATNLVSAAGSALGLVLQPDGKIVAAGTSVATSGFGLVRYDETGTLDASFGIGGVATTDFGPDSAYGRALARQPDGKLVVAGSVTQPGGSDFALARYDADGSLDTTFGLGGKVVTPVSATTDEIRAVAMQADGKIVVAGYAETPIGPFTLGSEFALARYKADGSLDPTFGSDGIVTTAIGFGSAESNAVVVEPSGKIVVAGWSDVGVTTFTLVRYLQDGSLDPEFGSGGIVTTWAGVSESFLYGLALDDGGRVVAAGAADNDWGNFDMAVARYNPDGTLDPTFGMAGVAQVDLGPGSWDIANGVATQSDGKVVVAGLANAAGFRRLGLARFITSTCGNGAREPAEQCDDGNLGIADGCDSLCRSEESVSVTVAAGGAVTSDSEADGATPADVVETAITSPNPGAITILETSPASPAVAGFELLDLAVNVTAPPATGAAPLVLTFRLDASAVPAGQDEQSIAIFRNGALVPECSGATGEAAPDPCIASRAQLGDGDIAITVLSSQASRWEFAVAACTPRKPGVCRIPARPGSGQLLLKRGTSPARNRLVWKWSHGPGALADLGDPTTSSDYVLCLIDQSGDSGVPLTAVPAGANGICVGKPCWSASGRHGFRYSDKNGASGGLRRLAMKSNTKGEANLNAQVGGTGLQFPALPLQLPVRVQLQRQDGVCWEATYSEAHKSKNDEYQFKGKAN